MPSLHKAVKRAWKRVLCCRCALDELCSVEAKSLLPIGMRTRQQSRLVDCWHTDWTLFADGHRRYKVAVTWSLVANRDMELHLQLGSDVG